MLDPSSSHSTESLAQPLDESLDEPLNEPFDIVIPLYCAGWNTQAVLEGLTHHYQPRTIHLITPAPSAAMLESRCPNWQTAPLKIHPEEHFFPDAELTKASLCAELNLEQGSLYSPGWFYQQLLKLGAHEGIPGLSEWFVVWDSDLLPVAAWPLLERGREGLRHTFALLQDNRYGNGAIVSRWGHWISTILGVEAIADPQGTLISHHMWFKQSHLQSFAAQINRYFDSEDHWLRLMMRSANTFGTYGEYWCYASWVAAQAPADLVYHPYGKYGATTERFFDDGTALFSTALGQFLQTQHRSHEAAQRDEFSPSYAEVMAFIQAAYGQDPLPSSLSFESSPRHLKKALESTHIEERRSRWNPRNASAATGFAKLRRIAPAHQGKSS